MRWDMQEKRFMNENWLDHMISVLLFVIEYVLPVAYVTVVIYVAGHFIAKYW